MTLQFSASDGALTSVSSSVLSASDTLELLATGVPTAPSAGVAEGMIADLLSDLVSAAALLSTDAQEAASRVTDSHWMYVGADQCAADGLPGRS